MAINRSVPKVRPIDVSEFFFFGLTFGTDRKKRGYLKGSLNLLTQNIFFTESLLFQ